MLGWGSCLALCPQRDDGGDLESSQETAGGHICWICVPPITEPYPNLPSGSPSPPQTSLPSSFTPGQAYRKSLPKLLPPRLLLPPHSLFPSPQPQGGEEVALQPQAEAAPGVPWSPSDP